MAPSLLCVQIMYSPIVDKDLCESRNVSVKFLLLSENKPYSLNSTYNFCALKNLLFRFQEKNLNLNRDSNLRSRSIGKSARLVIWRFEVRIPVEVRSFLLKSKLCQYKLEINALNVKTIKRLI